MENYRALTLNERISLYKEHGIECKDFSAYQRWIQIRGLLNDENISPVLRILDRTREDINLALQDLTPKEADLINHCAESHPWKVFYKSLVDEYKSHLLAGDPFDKTESDSVIDISAAVGPFELWARRELLKTIECLERIKVDTSALDTMIRTVNAALISSSIKTLLWEFHNQKETSTPIDTQDSNEDTQYIHFLKRLRFDPKYLLEFYDKYPVITRRLSIKCINQVQFFVEMLQRLDKDFDELCEIFFLDCGCHFLSDIEASKGDSHQQGKSVVIVSIGGGKIVYKPKNLELGLQFASFLDFINTESGLLDLHVGKRLYKNHYSYEEYVSYKECSSENQIKDYYERFGQLCAIVYMLAGTDIHYENIIAHMGYPVIVDIETLFQRGPLEHYDIAENAVMAARAENLSSVEGTHLLPMVFYSNDSSDSGVDLSGLSGQEQTWPHKVLSLTDLSKDTMRFEYQELVIKGANNIPMLNGETVPFDHYKDSIVFGFERMLQFFQSKKATLLSEGGEFNKFENLIVRCVLRPTVNYARYLDFTSHPNYSKDMSKLERMLYNAWAINFRDKRPVYYEIEDMLWGDIPIFFANTSESYLMASNGDIISSFFDEPPIIEAKKRLETLDDVAIQRQVTRVIVSLGMYNQVCEKELASRQNHSHSFQCADLDASAVLDEVESIIDSLLEKAIIHEPSDTITWNCVTHDVSRRNARIEPLGVGLASGLQGVLLFLLFAKATNNTDRYDNFIRRIVNTLNLWFKESTEPSASEEDRILYQKLSSIKVLQSILADVGGGSQQHFEWTSNVYRCDSDSEHCGSSVLKQSFDLINKSLSGRCLDDSLACGISGLFLNCIANEDTSDALIEASSVINTMIFRKRAFGDYSLQTTSAYSDIGLLKGISGVGLALLLYYTHLGTGSLE